MTIINIEVPAQPQDVGHLGIEVSTDKISWQSVDVNTLTTLDNPSTELYVRLTANNGPARLGTMKVIYE